ncbi:hypothetical protein FQR65_LT07482 [Abscondita terminalis]|nr:hypothetical protein FQR65_LT07482 [Abscondita terminalis]
MATSKNHFDIPDASGKVGAGMTDEKFSLYEASRTDSGFLSGNLVVSSEILSEEIRSEEIEPPSDSGVLEESAKSKSICNNQSVFMRLDSGVDLGGGLSESFSSLSLKNPGLNDLSSNKLKEPICPVELSKPEEQPPWELWFEQDEDGDTHLHTAVIQGFLEVVLALIRAAPRPHLLDTPNDDAQTALHLAVATKQWRIVRWLIVAGAKPSPRNLQGDSPLHICARTGDVQSCKAITDPVTQNERDALALSYPPLPYQQCQLDQWNYDGQTCVHVAAIYGHVDVLRHLVWNGADINAREGTRGYTALHYALERVDENMAHFLLHQCNKLNANVLTYGRRTVLQLGFSVPSSVEETLRSRGVDSPYSSEDEDEDSEDELPYENTNMYQSSVIQASA